MSIHIKKIHDDEYPYFRAGAKEQYALGTSTKPNIQNIRKALDYVTEKNSHYSKVEQELILMLPQQEKDQYISKRLKEFDSYSDKKLFSSLSEDARTKYLEKRTAELQTRLRQVIPLELNPDALTPLSPSDIDKMFQLEEPTSHTIYEIFDALWLWYIDKKKSGQTLFIEFTTLQIITKHSGSTLMTHLKEMEKQKLIKIRRDPATRIELKDKINNKFSTRVGRSIDILNKVIQKHTSEKIVKQTKKK